MALGRTFFTDMDRVFEDMTRGMSAQTVGFRAVDAYVDVESGRLTARFDLPGVDLDADSVGAHFDDGVLTVEAGTRTPGRTVQVSFGEGTSQTSIGAVQHEEGSQG